MTELWDAATMPVDDAGRQAHLESLIQSEVELFRSRTPKSRALFEEARHHLVDGVMCTWHSDAMRIARFPHPLYIERSKNNRIWDVDGNEYVDFNMGDTPDIFGHAPDNEVTRGVADHVLNQGANTFHPDPDSIVVSRLLHERFGLRYWYSALTASDAIRFSITMARVVTERPKILMFNFGYHGTVEDCLKWAPAPGEVAWRVSRALRPGEDPGATTKVVEFNDLTAVEEALAARDVALVLSEPLLTDGGFTLPRPGFHAGLRELCTKYGSYLLIDETHTQTAAPTGCTGLWDLDPDLLVLGKCVAGGFPGAVYGFTDEIGAKLEDHLHDLMSLGGLTGLGTTSTANALTMRALRLSLEHNYTDETFDKMLAAADRLVAGFKEVIAKHEAPFRVDQLGARVNLSFTPEPCFDPLSALGGLGIGGYHEYLTLYLYNRGVSVLPLLNMYMLAPQTTPSDCDEFIGRFDEAVGNMLTA